ALTNGSPPSSLLSTIFNKAEMFCIRVSGFASEPHIYCFVQGILLDVNWSSSPSWQARLCSQTRAISEVENLYACVPSLRIDCAPVRSKFLPRVSTSGRCDRHGGSSPVGLCATSGQRSDVPQ